MTSADDRIIRFHDELAAWLDRQLEFFSCLDNTIRHSPEQGTHNQLVVSRILSGIKVIMQGR